MDHDIGAFDGGQDLIVIKGLGQDPCRLTEPCRDVKGDDVVPCC